MVRPIRKIRLLFVGCLFVCFIGCKHEQMDILEPRVPKIIQILAPEREELPKAVRLSCEFENPQTIELHFKWEATSGTIIDEDSSSVLYLVPTRASVVRVTCTIWDSVQIFDKKSVEMIVTLPAYVGRYHLETLQVCDLTYNFNTNSPTLILEIYDTHTFKKGFAYSWKVGSGGISVPDSCHLQMPAFTHNGFMGPWSAKEDSLLYFSRPVQLGYITQILNWSIRGKFLILQKSSGREIWMFERRQSR